MRTAIFVYEPGKLSFSTTERGLTLERMTGNEIKLEGPAPLSLPVGVYKVISQDPIGVKVDQTITSEVVIITGDLTDEVPEPRPKLLPTPDDPDSSASRAFRAACKAFLAHKPKNDEK